MSRRQVARSASWATMRICGTSAVTRSCTELPWMAAETVNERPASAIPTAICLLPTARLAYLDMYHNRIHR